MEWFNGRPTMVHPDHIAPLDERRQPAAGRAGVSADGGTIGQGAAPRDRPGAGAAPCPARLARRDGGEEAELSCFRGSAEAAARSGRSDRRFARGRGVAAARL